MGMINKILFGDCLEIMKKIPDNVIDVIITDPPYGINKNKILGDESLAIWKASLSDSFRVLKPISFYCLFCSVEKIPEVMQEATKLFDYRWQVIFYVNNGMVRGSMGFSVYYPCLIFMKGQAKIRKQLKDVYEVSTSSKEMKQRVHPYQKDLGFVSKLVETCSNESNIVLDPFIGSGTTALACIKTNRRFIGIEKDQYYWEVANKRIAELNV